MCVTLVKYLIREHWPNHAHQCLSYDRVLLDCPSWQRCGCVVLGEGLPLVSGEVMAR